MRDIAVLVLVGVLLVLALRRVFSAYALWMWMGLIALQDYVYGFMGGVPYVMIFALVTLVKIPFSSRQGESSPSLGNATSVLMVIFLVHLLISQTVASHSYNRAWQIWQDLAKSVLLCLIMPAIVTTRLRLNVLLMILAAGVAFHGVVDGLKFLASGGSHIARGVAKHGDNNHYALLLAMVLPLLLYASRQAAERWVQWAWLAALVLSTLAVVSTRSRGAAISLGVIAIFLVVLSKRRVALGFMVLVIGAAVGFLAPDEWFSRIRTVEAAQEDLSFLGRVVAWKRSTAVARDNPIFGGGIYAIQTPEVHEQYRDDQGLLGFIDTPYIEVPKAAHSIYFQVLGDAGFLGAAIYLTVIAHALFLGYRTRLRSADLGQEGVWLQAASTALIVSLVCFCVGGAALSLAYYELPFVIMMLLQILYLQGARMKSSGQSSASPWQASQTLRRDLS